MRHFFIPCLLCGLMCTEINAQNSFQSSSPYTGKIVNVNGNDVMLPAYVSTDDKFEGSNYFSKEWIPGSVTTTDNNVFSTNLLFMYDKVNHELYYKKKDSFVTWKVDLSKVSGFSLTSDKPHIFMKAEYFNRDYTGEYFEVLLLDEKKYSLLKFVKTSFEQNNASKGAQAMAGSFSTGSYVDKTRYFLCKNGISTEVVLKRKKFEEALGPDAQKAEAYFKDRSLGFNEQSAISVLTEVNSQLD